MDKAQTIKLLEQIVPLTKDQVADLSVAEKIESYIPLALKMAYRMSYKYGKQYEDVAELTLYVLTKTLNREPKSNTSYIKKAVGGETFRLLFEDKTIRVPEGSKAKVYPTTEPANEASDKIAEEVIPKLMDRLEDLPLTDLQQKIINLRLKGSGEEEIAQAVGLTSRTVYSETQKIRGMARA
jgi:DNA-directed RNA polymerase specialized sigma subunit